MKKEEELTVAGLAHDLNNVFETLSEAADLLTGDAKWNKLAATIQRCVRRGAGIVDSLTETFGEEGDLEEILDNAIQHTNDVLTFTRGTAITYSRQIATPVSLPGFAAAWERVFVNLFLNAAQASPLGVQVNIAAQVAGSSTMLTVSDDGPGIPLSILPIIFEPHVTTKKSRGRSGLGMHIVHSIVTECGGQVKASNGVPKGAIFHITVPAVE